MHENPGGEDLVYDISDACMRRGDRAAAVYPFRVPDYAAVFHVPGAFFLYNITVLFHFIFL